MAGGQSKTLHLINQEAKRSRKDGGPHSPFSKASHQTTKEYPVSLHLPGVLLSPQSKRTSLYGEVRQRLELEALQKQRKEVT